MAQKHIPSDILALYDVFDYKHAAAILKHDFPKEYKEICDALRNFRLTADNIKKAGGNESEMPKKLAKLLPLWKKQKLKINQTATDQNGIVTTSNSSTHIIDFFKNKVALDMEWNSKDQTYDRDLYAFRAFFEFGQIDIAIIVTRGKNLVSFFKSLGTYKKNGKTKAYAAKYGASTTHWGKLIPRLEGGRSGGCPVLAFGITDKVIAKNIKKRV
ncbi:MAG: hypothetical protein KF846_11670 [Cyclobacteriaceae bacterium]|nr:hypothetical protein [Cyclobacteriaceae bacterium]